MRSRPTQEFGVVTGRRDGRRLLGRTAALDGHERIDAPVEKATMRDVAKTSATMAGACTFMAQVRAGLPLAPRTPWPPYRRCCQPCRRSLRRGRADHRQSSRCPPAPARRDGGVGEAGDADHALARRRTLCHARQRRSHLAGDAQHQNVTGENRQARKSFRWWRAEEVLELGNGSEALRQARCVRVAIMPSRGARGDPRLRAGGIGRMAGNPWPPPPRAGAIQ